MTQAVAAGLTLGLAAGLAPGPLQALIVTSTLRRGFSAGWRVAIAPLLTDVVIVAASVGVLATLPDRFLAGLGTVGGLVLVGLVIGEIARARRPAMEDAAVGGSASDVALGALVNVTNPHAWIFWIVAGGPLVVSLWRSDPGAATAFLVPFYVMLVGSKVGLAAAVAAVRRALDERWRRRLLTIGGMLLIAGGIVVAAGFARG